MKTNFSYIIFSLAICAVLFNPKSAYSQNDSLLENQNEIYLKLPVSPLVGDIFTSSYGASLGLEKVGKKGWSFGQEAGFLLDVPGHSSIFGGESVDQLRGIRLTSEVRKYFKTEKLKPHSGFFVSTEWDNIITQSKLSYSETAELEYGYRTSLSANAGFKVFWDKEKTGNLTLEFLAGPSLMYADAPYIDKNGFGGWLNFDFKLGYLLR
ncbi:hypothetical protein [Salibacter halophilus]|uniref:Outer membrane beta-barrel protein n=1 Tax=Salibacter halophilus TaxID=1803916 RepID=A0A6N6M7K9_9FLAO|nr:hypothetical protein [Salibacter halophilus]KAB1066060.1 hypothetical protein F3059_00910 [Salibacter halophilus]